VQLETPSGLLRRSSFVQLRAWVRDSSWLSWTLGIFLAGFLAAWSTRVHRDVLYLLVILPFLLALRWQDWRLLLSSRVFQFLILWVLLLTLSITWSDPALLTKDAVYDKLRYAFLILSFVAVTAWVVASRDDWFERMALMLVPVAAFVLIYSVVIYYADHSFPSARLGNMVFYRESPNRGSVGFLLVALIGLAALVKTRRPIFLVVGWVGLIAGLAFILLAQSRGLFLAFLVGAFVQLVYYGYWRVVLFLSFGGALVVMATDLLDIGVRSFIDRADARRFVVWAAVIERIQENLWLGEGLIIDRSIDGADGRTYYSPHSVWLMSTLVAGLPGLVSWLLLVLVAAREGVMQYRAPPLEQTAMSVLGLSMLAAGVVLLSFAGHEIIDQVSPHFWLALWLPLGLVAGYEVRRRVLPPNGSGHDTS